uniref:Uncharacterized protein n=1 Tax=Anguilla anguilla TaxID=7936 RepID=A0A0E9UGJ7_ANGAN
MPGDRAGWGCRAGQHSGWVYREDPGGGRLPVRLLHRSRVLLLEEHGHRLLVHPVPVRDDGPLQPRAGGHADPDARQPQGGAELRVQLQPPASTARSRSRASSPC